MKIALKVKLLLVLVILPFSSMSFETSAKQALVMDVETGKILFEKDGYEKMYPSSMSKLMTAYVVFDKVKNGNLRLTDQFRTSEHAWSLRGSSMFLPVGRYVTVEELLKGLIVQSGNDAAVVLAEGVSGGEEEFAAMMNNYAVKMNLKNSNFVNATGWPDPMHYSSCYDLATIALRTIKDFPEYYSFYKIPEYTYNDIKQYNRNSLISMNPFVDGLKTGHTDIAGYGIVLSGEKQGRRLIVVVNGLPSDKQRAFEAERLFNYGLLNFQNVIVAKAGQTIAETDVYSGKKDKLAMKVKEDFIENIPSFLAGKIQIIVNAKTPLVAPINKGAEVGEVTLLVDGKEARKMKLEAAEDVDSAGFYQRMLMNIKNFFAKK
jgi:D-alanyl-D-alanine carboxypeptidase (penicillin-binding protein 5/6)